MSSALVKLVGDTIVACEQGWSALLGRSAQEIEPDSLDAMKKAFVDCQREARGLSAGVKPAAQAALGTFLEAVRSADKSRRVLAGLVAQRERFTRRSASAAARDFEAMEDRLDSFMEDLNTVTKEGNALKVVLKRSEARVQRPREIKVVIDDEAG
ncbi:hypothetical protein ACFYO2_35795 [Streptomyces sp. NPDC006602]|uniref:hypothetical protein n=1 Tax=Streptomyces sp. NPDC006602 TaxID=3364751 RepID=UPI00367C9497